VPWPHTAARAARRGRADDPSDDYEPPV
jgi:hypothetical protein